MAGFRLFALLAISTGMAGVYATDDICTRGPIRFCPDNNALEQLLQVNGPVINLHRNFTLSGTLDGISKLYALTSFTPNNERNAVPSAAFVPAP